MKYIVVLALALLTGCATTTPLTPENAQKLSGESLVVTKREAPNFIAMTSTKGFIGALGAIAAITEGNELAEKTGMQDPADDIAETIAARLAAQHGMTFGGQTEQTVSGTDSAEIANAVDNVTYVVDVATRNWSFMYDGFNFSDYNVNYIADLKLIDTRTGQAITEGECQYNSKEEIGTVPYDKLVADNAAFIKEQLSAAADLCASQFSTELFRL